MNIAALVSGGVDSSVVVHLLKEQGITPDIFYIRIGMEDEDGYIACPAEEDIEITQWIAHHYGCSFQEVNLHKEYWDTVVSYTIDSVRRGLTPNPDVMCNKLIKFGVFDERVGYAYDRIATGHYATSTIIDGITFLSTALDPVKDQTDFLSQLSYKQIQRLLFPIGTMMKSQVRQIAAHASLPSATRKDSQGICFLGKINYNDFIRRYLGTKEGPIIELETGRILGKHQGYWFHTIGQRKGLYLSGGPWFVVRKDIEQNIIYVSQGYNPDAAHGRVIPLGGFHLLSGRWPKADNELLPDSFTDANWPDCSIDITFKIRHTPEFHTGQLIRTDNGDIKIDSIDPIQGIASGQYATIYDTSSHIAFATGMIL